MLTEYGTELYPADGSYGKAVDGEGALSRTMGVEPDTSTSKGHKEGNQMTRRECEERIADMIGEIFKVYQTYNPEGNYLMMHIYRDDEGTWVSFNNEVWPGGADCGKPVDKCFYMEVR